MKIDNFHLNSNELNSIKTYTDKNCFPQTMIVEGGDSKTRADFSLFLAQTLLCTSKVEKPCGSCPSCIKCEANSHPDIKIYAPEKENATIKVQVSREIRADAFVLPNDGEKKVYIINEAQNMNEEGQNALLKILEEPPFYDYFILSCDSRSALLETVLSRATVINLGEKAESYSQETTELAGEIINALCTESELKLLEALAPLSMKKDNFENNLTCLEFEFLNSLKLKRVQHPNFEYSKAAETLSLKFSENKLYALIRAVQDIKISFKQNANFNLLVTNLAIELKKAVNR